MAKSPSSYCRGKAQNRLLVCKAVLFCSLGLFVLPLLRFSSDASARLSIFRFVGYASPSVTAPSPPAAGTRTPPPPSPSDDEAVLQRATPAVQKLVEAIRHATLRAEDGRASNFTDADRSEWHGRNPCSSRQGLAPLYASRKHVKDVPRNEQWDLVFREYAKLHRTCMAKVGGDLRQHFESRDTSTGCKFVVAETHYGLGNRIYQVSSVVMFAVLRQRVVLVPSSTLVPSVMCEPFEGSSWKMDEELYEAVKQRRAATTDFYAGVDRDLDDRGPFDLFASHTTDKWGPEHRFYCNTEQRYLSHVTWVTMDGCLLFMPKLWSVDMFRPALEGLFPHRIAFTYLLRSAMLPADHVWERFLRVKEQYLSSSAEKQVGIQVRYFGGEQQFRDNNDVINDRILRCLWENKILPELCGPTSSKCDESSKSKLRETPRTIRVLVASLFDGVRESLNRSYQHSERIDSPNPTAVNVVQLSQELTQGSGLEVDTQALVEILSLSLSDALLVSPRSTFGGVAQAYGGLLSWLIDVNRPKGEADRCLRSMGIDPCHLGGKETYDCRHDPRGQTSVLTAVPYLKQCYGIEYGWDGAGLQLVPDKPEEHDFSF